MVSQSCTPRSATTLRRAAGGRSSLCGWALHEEDPPAPPEASVRLLARLGELVYQRGAPFLPGERLEVPDATGAIPPAVAWAEGPEVGPIATRFGAVQFVATLGIPLPTLAKMRATSTSTVVGEIRENNPPLIVGKEGLNW
jgi:hypothetical protein